METDSVRKPASRWPALCLFGLLSILAAPASANTWECGERSNLPQKGKTYCAAGDFRQSRANLAKVLALLFEKHQAAYGDATNLSNAQSAFETYRDAQCAAQNRRIEDKPFHPMIVAQCKTQLTNLRIDELKRMLEKSQ